MTEAPTPAAGPVALAATYFDGTSARGRAVTLRLDGAALCLSGDGIERLVALRDVNWPEQTRHGMRAAHFKDGGSVLCADVDAWDAWSGNIGVASSLVVRLQQSWRWTLACALTLVVLFAAMLHWGMPLAARAIVAALPHDVEVRLGESVLPVLDQHVMRPSRLSLQEQGRLREALVRALQAAPRHGPSNDAVPAWNLVFRQSRIGPNALALPGGTLIMTDELVELVGRDEKVIVAVLAHEMGHLRRRHSLRMMVQVAMLSALSALVLGDFSTLLAGAPVLLGHASYSRDAEREADLDAVRTLQAAGISPAVMLTLFEKLDEYRRMKASGAGQAPGEEKSARKDSTQTQDQETSSDSWLGIAFASHPSDAERVRFFKEAAAAPQKR